MKTTVTTKNMVTIPATVGRHFGIRPGYMLDWTPVAGTDQIRVQVIPDRAELARRLAGTGKTHGSDRKAVEELVAEREREG